MVTIEKRVEEIFSLFEKYGDSDYIGESISQLEHAVQGAQLAEEEGYSDEVIIAALLHDIGHLCDQDGKYENMGTFGRADHEKIGGDYLRKLGFPELVTFLVENHVQAKRYLTFRNPRYFETLSEASLQTLGYQGGPMNVEEAASFEADPNFQASLEMRTWDELAKKENFPVPDLTRYKEMCSRILESTATSH